MENIPVPAWVKTVADDAISEGKKQIGRFRTHLVRSILGLVSGVISVFGLSAFYAFVHDGRYFFTQTWIMRIFWFIGMFLFLIYFFRQFHKSVKTGSDFPWLPTLLVFGFAGMSYWLYIPSRAPGLIHNENPEELRQFMADNQYNADGLIRAAVRLHVREEYAWSYLYFDAALKTQRAKLNQAYPFYVSDLFMIGMDKSATNAATDMLEGIQSDFGSRWPQASYSNILSDTIQNAYQAEQPLTADHKTFFKDFLIAQLESDYQKSITNNPVSQR